MQYCLAAGATQGNIAYTQNVIGYPHPFTLKNYAPFPKWE
jgi:hypothetical protein